MWDYDSIAECILFERDGQKLLGHFDKNGYFFVLDRTNGELRHVTPFVDRIDWGVITRDGKVTPRKYPEKEGEPVHFYPGPAGAKEWTHAAYSPKTGLFYVPVADTGPPPPGVAGSSRRAFRTGARAFRWTSRTWRVPSARSTANGEEKWRWRNELPMCASVLATGGDLVFAGEPHRGVQRDQRPHRGDSCGSSSAEAAITAARSTYSVDGKQYIAVPVGWGALGSRAFLPGMLGAGHGSALIAFALPD